MSHTEASVEARILQILAEVSSAPRDQITADADFASLRLDSVGTMELVGMLCDEFTIDVELEEVFAVNTVREAVAMTLRHLDARA